MKRNILFCCVVFSIVSNYIVAQPKIFAPGIISTQDDEFGITFSPDMQLCFFTKKTPSTLNSSTYVICYSRFINNQWQEPELAPFSGRYKDLNPYFSPDGSKLFFISTRPAPGRTTRDADIWVVKRMDGNTWSEPENIGAPVNSDNWELSCAVTKDGTLYFTSLNVNTGRQGVYYSKFAGGKYAKPEIVGDTANSFEDAADIFIAPDESYLLFSTSSRDDVLRAGTGASAGYPRSDLYISNNNNGQWTKPVNVGTAINSTAQEANPTVSPDGKLLFYACERNFITIPMPVKLTYASLEQQLHSTANGLGDIYYIPMSEIAAKQKN